MGVDKASPCVDSYTTWPLDVADIAEKDRTMLMMLLKVLKLKLMLMTGLMLLMKEL